MSYTAANRMNLAALQRVDSAISEIIDTASQVALYKFSSAANGWERTEIEGALFVFAWTRSPCHGLLVMNRLSTTNFLEPITQEFEFHVQTPFLLYKKANDIFGVWFYEEKECKRIGEVCQSLASMPNKSRGRQRCMSESDSHSKTGGTHDGDKSRDIVSLLARAKDQYDMKTCETSTIGPRSGGGRSRSRKQSSSAVRNGTVFQATDGHQRTGDCGPVVKPTPIRAASNELADPASSTPLSVETLFSAAMSAQCNGTPPRTCRPSSTGSAGQKIGGGEELLQELLANPANLLEQVERVQHNESKAVETSQRQRAQSCSMPVAVRQVEQDLRQKLNLEANKGCNGVAPLITPAMLEGGGARPAKSASPTTSFILPTPGTQYKKAPPASELPLLSPMAFTKSSSAELLDRVASPLPGTVMQQEIRYLNGNTSGALILPNSPLLPRNGPQKKAAIAPLTKEQIRDALVHMLQNDEGFLLKIHEAYISSLSSRFGLGSL